MLQDFTVKQLTITDFWHLTVLMTMLLLTLTITLNKANHGISFRIFDISYINILCTSV